MKYSIFAWISVGLLAAACDEDVQEPMVDDAGNVICTGHACPDSPVYLPEGGEIRLELVFLSDGPAEVRSHAWFASDQDPALRPYTTPPDTWRTIGEGFCTDMTGQVYWPSGNPISRTYVDAGPTVSITGDAGAITLNKAMPGQDTAFNDFHDIIYLNDTISPTTVVEGAEYTADVSGSDSYAARTMTTKLVMPEPYQITFPDMTDQVLIPMGHDFPLTWTNAVDQDYYYAFVVFADLYDSYYRCFGPNIGEFSIPLEVIQALPPGGYMQHGIMYHRSENVDGRRVDMIAINCYQATYAVVP